MFYVPRIMWVILKLSVELCEIFDEIGRNYVMKKCVVGWEIVREICAMNCYTLFTGQKAKKVVNMPLKVYKIYILIFRYPFLGLFFGFPHKRLFSEEQFFLHKKKQVIKLTHFLKYNLFLSSKYHLLIHLY